MKTTQHIITDMQKILPRSGRLILPAIIAAMATGILGCSEETPMVSLGIDDYYVVARMQKLSLSPALTGEGYRWTVDGVEVSSGRELLFLSADEGIHEIVLEIIDPDNPMRHEITVEVVHEDVEYSPYISRVLEYRPAPGQFVNEMPLYEEGDTEADMIGKVEECICGTANSLITLGAWGGYVTFAFDHTVMNVPGENDLYIKGNAFYQVRGDRPGGNAEPGIIMVSLDVNGNGLPDDEWYELRGSAHSDPATRHDYSVTYYPPQPGHEIITSAIFTDEHYIRWEDSLKEEGWISANTFHSQPYFPQWLPQEPMTFSGTRLPDNGVDEGGLTGYVLYTYSWGYADNHPNTEETLCSVDISNAINSAGEAVSLPGVDFVRVYTGVNQYCGRIGEISTEISQACDLHVRPSE